MYIKTIIHNIFQKMIVFGVIDKALGGSEDYFYIPYKFVSCNMFIIILLFTFFPCSWTF
jgi:hypothetical protein